MVIVLLVILTWSWVEQEVSSDQLEDHASIAPEISRGIVVYAHDNFRSSILPRLDLRHEVIVGPAAVTKITDLDIDVFIN